MIKTPLIKKVVGNLTDEEVAKLFIARFSLPWRVDKVLFANTNENAIQVYDEYENCVASKEID